MRVRKAIAIAFLGACAVGAVAPRGARAEDAGRDDAVARVVEAATTRMKALLEEARLLEAAGRRDDALAALKSIAGV